MKEEPMLERLIELLCIAGESEEEAKHLLARFLEEQAYDYVECMKIMREQIRRGQAIH